MTNIWWEQNAGSHNFLQTVIEELLNNQSIQIITPEHIPWRDEAISIVKEKIHKENASRSLIECNGYAEDPGEYLLNSCCREPVRINYRYGTSYAKFLADCKETVLNHRYVYISNVDSVDEYERWVDFINEYLSYVKDGESHGVFVLEVNQKWQIRNKKNIKCIQYFSYVKTYSEYAYCAMVTSQSNCDDAMKVYLTDLVNRLCGRNVELSERCIAYGDMFLRNTEKKYIEARQEYENESGCRTEEIDVHKKIWEAQLNFVFPLIETYRQKFVQVYRNLLEDLISQKVIDLDDIVKAEDLEIGNLVYLCKYGYLNVTHEEWIDTDCCRLARNKLAHLDVVSYEMITHIIGSLNQNTDK